MDALDANPNNLGIGVLHEGTGRIHLAPFDVLRGFAHRGLVQQLGFPENECKGFAIGRKADGSYEVANESHLNEPQGQPGSLQMPEATFAQVMKALQDAGLPVS